MKKLLFRISIYFFVLAYMLRKRSLKKRDISKIGFLVDEFFHTDCNGFGGYGITVKNITEYFNNNPIHIQCEVLLTRSPENTEITLKHYHSAKVLFRPGHTRHYLLNFMKYAHIASQRKLNLLISIDFYQSYEYSCLALPKTPLLIWIHDPRSLNEWRKISTVPTEMQASGNYTIDNLNEIVMRKKTSIQRMLQQSKTFNRKTIFATQARCLLLRAKLAYGLPDIEALFLPNPIPLPEIKDITFSSKPSICLLGRLEPIKRPWIFFELAKRFPAVDFLVAGKSHFPELMASTIKRYTMYPNLKFLGMVDREEKGRLLENTWCLMNTSIHEALPVSFLEAFSYGKTVISCQNPDNLTERFGFYTGEILGEGLDTPSLDMFSRCLEKLLENKKDIAEKGYAARKYVAQVHSFSNYKSIIISIIDSVS